MYIPRRLYIFGCVWKPEGRGGGVQNKRYLGTKVFISIEILSKNGGNRKKNVWRGLLAPPSSNFFKSLNSVLNSILKVKVHNLEVETQT